jgi:AcrR family transcriptional regulator
MRRLAAELRAAPMAAYAHFADKDELLAEVVDAVMGEVDLPDADGRGRKPLRRHAQIFALPQSAYPDLTAVMPHVLAVDGEDRFRYGLDRIFDGLAGARRPT